MYKEINNQHYFTVVINNKIYTLPELENIFVIRLW